MGDQAGGPSLDTDVVVVGAGFAGLYMLHRLRAGGFGAIGVEVADDVGGTWYWNRYPGARCDIQSIDYSYSFDPELDAEWEWSEKYATQPEILAYLRHVADRHDLRRDIRFRTRLERASWDEDAATWTVHIGPADPAAERVDADAPAALRCRYLVMATGCLSVPKVPDVPGADRFAGPTYSTATWPPEGVDFTGRRVAVIGTGSSGIQSIPLIAEEADQLTVFQRTPNFSFPAGNGPIPTEKLAAFRADRDAYREEARWSGIGVPNDPPLQAAADLDPDELQRRLDEVWRRGELVAIGSAYRDWLIDPTANQHMAEFVRTKIRDIVDDPAVAEALCPTDYPIGTKRPCLDTGYYATFNRPNVRLVDLRATPIETITETGIALGGPEGEELTFDAIVYATGFDAMTGALVGVDLRGRDGVTLAEKWAHGPETYLGLMSVGFPNLFMITGPGSPSVLSNMVVSIEQHVEWITDALERLRTEGLEEIEPTPTAESAWVRYTNDFADLTLYPRADSWYIGANVEGKPRVFLPYVGSVGRYRRICDEVVAREYLGFEMRGPGGRVVCHDGEIRRIRPDVEAYLDAIEEAGLPPFDSMTPEAARMLTEALNTVRPPGPEVGAITDGTFPGPTGDLDYRRYAPATPGPHPIVVYFHGGGWLWGGAAADDPLCRDLCVRADAVVVSLDYRHAPEHPFPAAVEDAVAGLSWVAAHAGELGGDGERLAVCGWSAGGNLAAVVALLARDAGGPALSGQVLINPVTDFDTTRPSRIDNAERFGLTAATMNWFSDHYTTEADRLDWRAAPLRAPDLSGLPPAVVVTTELDPLRDEGDEYAEALAAAGVEVCHVEGWGQSHLSVPSVGLIVTADPIRAEIGAQLRRMLAVGTEAAA